MMNQKKTIYYLAFPVFIFMLCMFSYQLGFKKGVTHHKNEQISKVLDELESSEGETGKLTYYQELNDNKNPIVAQANADQNKKSQASVTIKPSTTIPVTSTSTTEVQPSLVVNADKQMTAIQVGAFTDLGKADELTDRLKNSGFEAFTKPIQSKGNELFRVLVKSSKTEVASTQAKLADQGYKGFVVSK